MGQPISRRSFLKGGIAAAAGQAAASGIPTTRALATADESKQLATLIDISKCNFAGSHPSGVCNGLFAAQHLLLNF